MVLLSGNALAEASAREFEMVWNPNPHCNCSFDALFENQLPARAGAAPDMTRWRDFRRYPPSKIPDLLADPTPHLCVVHFYWLINPGAYPAHRPLETRMQKLLSELEPLAPLGVRIEAFQSASFRPRMIGVHLRRGDFTAARGDVVDNLKPACDAVDAFLERAPWRGLSMVRMCRTILWRGPTFSAPTGCARYFRAAPGNSQDISRGLSRHTCQTMI